MTLPPLPDGHALMVLALAGLALILFTRERIALESSSLFVVLALAVGFSLFPYTGPRGPVHALAFFYGFGHEALVAVSALMIAGQGLVRTGALEPVGRAMARLWTVSPKLSLLAILAGGGLLSAFVNNTPVVVLLLPILVGVSLRTRTPSSELLMPMGLATLVGGMSTTIGTSTNLLVVAVAADLGLGRMGLFDFFLPAVVAGGIGILYLWLLAPRILPVREPLLADTSPRHFRAGLTVLEEGFAAGKTLAEALGATDGLMKVLRIERGEGTFVMPLPDAGLRPGDRLIVEDTPARLKEFEQLLGCALYAGPDPVDEEHPLPAEDQQLAEIVVVQGSPLESRTLSEVRFADRYQLVTLALHHGGRSLEPQGGDVGDVRLGSGDVLLVQGARDQIATVKRSGELLVLDATSDLPHSARAPLALALMAAAVALSAFGILPIAISASGAALAMVATGCLSWRDATLALNAQVVLLVVASLALGMALTVTGGTDYLAGLFLAAAAGLPAWAVVSSLMLLMAALTNVVSNNAAAVIGTPVAVQIAATLGAPPEPFVLAVLFGANMSYATPMAYKTNLLVMNAGGYTFGDFLRVGVPLTLLMWLALTWLLRVRYGL